MDAKIITVLGSARFCREWSQINDRLIEEDEIDKIAAYVVLFFLPHWDYQVSRENCISLLEKIAQQQNMILCIKAHTRGTGALEDDEKAKLRKCGSVEFPGEAEHSPRLIKQSDIVINFGSSIAFEALRQGKPVINPSYLHRNDTFFDDSGAVFDTTSEVQTLEVIQGLESGRIENMKTEIIEKFLHERVDGGGKGHDVLQSYLDLFLQDRDA
jgi:predicted glycosyltransferase